MKPAFQEIVKLNFKTVSDKSKKYCNLLVILILVDICIADSTRRQLTKYVHNDSDNHCKKEIFFVKMHIETCI